ncbi:MAG: AbrB/MazE/SpoVT family DNA-binding domain-containing protein [Patescibacteria group bacterium]
MQAKMKTRQVTLTTNQTVRIPTAIVHALGFSRGMEFDVHIRDGGIFLSPMLRVPRSQAYFWTKEWQEEERKVNKEIAGGRVRSFDRVKDFVADLHDADTD